MLVRFRADGTVMSLIETKRGRRTGHRALDAPREEIIEKAIRTYYLETNPADRLASWCGTLKRIALRKD